MKKSQEKSPMDIKITKRLFTCEGLVSRIQEKKRI